jgi:sensor domain CHASE-containing protein
MNFLQNNKRLVLIIVISLIVIFVSKALLSKAAKNLSLEAQKKQQLKSHQQLTTLPASAVVLDNAPVQISTEAVTTSTESAPAVVTNTPAAN